MSRKRAYSYARKLLDEHGLKGWMAAIEPIFIQNVRGYCCHQTQTITLDETLVEFEPWCEIRETILHEVAHALCRPPGGHGPSWQRKAREIGVSDLEVQRYVKY